MVFIPLGMNQRQQTQNSGTVSFRNIPNGMCYSGTGQCFYRASIPNGILCLRHSVETVRAPYENAPFNRIVVPMCLHGMV